MTLRRIFQQEETHYDAIKWRFLWSAPERTAEQTIKTPVIWYAIVLVVTSLQCILSDMETPVMILKVPWFINWNCLVTLIEYIFVKYYLLFSRKVRVPSKYIWISTQHLNHFLKYKTWYFSLVFNRCGAGIVLWDLIVTKHYKEDVCLTLFSWCSNTIQIQWRVSQEKLNYICITFVVVLWIIALQMHS